MGPPQIIAKVREITGISRDALARKLGTSKATLDRWSAGKGAPPQEVIDLLQGIVRLSRRRQTKARVRSAAVGPSQVLCGDCRSALVGVPSASVHMILSDIPYGIGHDGWDVLHDNKNSAYLGKSAAQERAGAVFSRRRKPINGWSGDDRRIPQQYQEFCASFAAEWQRVLKPGGSAVVFAGRRLAPRLVVALEEVGFHHRDMLSWRRPGAVLRAQRLSIVYQRRGELDRAREYDGWRVGNLKPSFEPIIWCFKPYRGTIADNMLEHGVGALNFAGYEEHSGSVDNTLEVGFDKGEEGLHEAQKPTRLLRALIALCTQPGQLVLDSFAGSGSTGVAAAQLGRRYLLVEKDAKLCRIAERRLAPLSPRSAGKKT